MKCHPEEIVSGYYNEIIDLCNEYEHVEYVNSTEVAENLIDYYNVGFAASLYSSTLNKLALKGIEPIYMYQFFPELKGRFRRCNWHRPAAAQYPKHQARYPSQQGAPFGGVAGVWEIPQASPYGVKYGTESGRACLVSAHFCRKQPPGHGPGAVDYKRRQKYRFCPSCYPLIVPVPAVSSPVPVQWPYR